MTRRPSGRRVYVTAALARQRRELRHLGGHMVQFIENPRHYRHDPSDCPKCGGSARREESS